MKDYTYTPLNDKVNSFRVLAILPAWRKTSRLECELVEADLDDLDAAVFHFYEALSYTWGDASDTEDIKLDGCRFLVTRSLAAALRQLRAYRPKSDGITFIWVDAICINQSSVSERNAQVAKMGTIYSRCEQVVVWLGPSAHDSQLAMRTIDKVTDMDTPAEWLAQSLQNPDDLPAWQAVARLLLRPYWWRVWITQEILLGPEVVVTCGKDGIRWEVFIHGCELLRQELALFQSISVDIDEHATALQYVITLDDLLTDFQKDGQLNLKRMLLHAKACDCTNPRDRVFGYLGLIGDQARSIALDYNLDVAQVLVHAVKTSIITSGSLEILASCQNTSQLTDLPSWTPDVRLQWQATPLRPFDDEPYNASLQNAPVFSFPDDGKTLLVRGIIVDTVSDIADGPQPQPGGLYQILPAWKELARRYVDPSDIDEAFWRTLIADQDINGDRAKSEMVYNTGTLKGTTLSYNTSQSVPNLDITGWEQQPDYSLFVDRIGLAAGDRQLFATAASRIGLGASLCKDDLVCIIYGIAVPMILRSTDRGYLVIGEAYVHGLMDGEAFNACDSSEVQDLPLI